MWKFYIEILKYDLIVKHTPVIFIYNFNNYLYSVEAFLKRSIWET